MLGMESVGSGSGREQVEVGGSQVGAQVKKNAQVEVNLQANMFKAFYENYARLLSGNNGKIKDGMVEGFQV